MAARAKGRPRTAARVGAVQALFQSEQAGQSAEAVIEQFLRHRIGGGVDDGFEEGFVPDAQADLFVRIVRAAVLRQDEIDRLVADALTTDWTLPRLDPVLRAVLRAGGAELAMPDGPPARVVINEYLDVAHGFFAGEEPAMVNGLMERMARSLRPREFEG